MSLLAGLKFVKKAPSGDGDGGLRGVEPAEAASTEAGSEVQGGRGDRKEKKGGGEDRRHKDKKRDKKRDKKIKKVCSNNRKRCTYMYGQTETRTMTKPGTQRGTWTGIER